MSSEPSIGPQERPREFVPVGANAELLSTGYRAVLATGAIWAVEVVAAAQLAQSVHVAAEWRAGGGRMLITHIADLDDTTELLHHVRWLAIGVSALALAWWSRGVAINARRRGVPGVAVGTATFSWVIPLFGIAPAIRQLEQSVDGVGYSPHRLVRWRVSSYLLLPFMAMAWLVAMRPTTTATTVAEHLDAFDHRNMVLGVMTAVLLALAIVATLAVRHTDRAVSRI